MDNIKKYLAEAKRQDEQEIKDSEFKRSLPLDVQSDMFNQEPSKKAPRNMIIDALGLPPEYKMTNQEDQEWKDHFAENAVMGSIGGVGKGAKSLAQMLAETPAGPFGRVIDRSPAVKEGFGKVLKKGMEAVEPVVEAVKKAEPRDDVYTAIKKLLEMKK